MFLPWLYSSQPCEQLFRTTRSLSSTFNTAANFSIKEFNSTINDAFDDSQKLLRTLGIIMQEETMIIDDLVLNISIEKLYKTMDKTVNDDYVSSDVNFITSDGDPDKDDLGENMNDSVNYHDNNKTDLNPDEIDNELDLCNQYKILKNF